MTTPAWMMKAKGFAEKKADQAYIACWDGKLELAKDALLAAVDLSSGPDMTAITLISPAPQTTKEKLIGALQTLTECGLHVKSMQQHSAFKANEYPELEVTLQIDYNPKNPDIAEVLTGFYAWATQQYVPF